MEPRLQFPPQPGLHVPSDFTHKHTNSNTKLRLSRQQPQSINPERALLRRADGDLSATRVTGHEAGPVPAIGRGAGG